MSFSTDQKNSFSTCFLTGIGSAVQNKIHFVPVGSTRAKLFHAKEKEATQLFHAKNGHAQGSNKN